MRDAMLLFSADNALTETIAPFHRFPGMSGSHDPCPEAHTQIVHSGKPRNSAMVLNNHLMATTKALRPDLQWWRNAQCFVIAPLACSSAPHAAMSCSLAGALRFLASRSSALRSSGSGRSFPVVDKASPADDRTSPFDDRTSPATQYRPARPLRSLEIVDVAFLFGLANAPPSGTLVQCQLVRDLADFGAIGMGIVAPCHDNPHGLDGIEDLLADFEF